MVIHGILWLCHIFPAILKGIMRHQKCK